MKIYSLLILLILIVSTSLLAENTPFDLQALSKKPTIKRFTPNEMEKLQAIALQNTKKSNPALYKQILNNKNIAPKAAKDDVGDTWDFTVYNIEDENYYQVSATLRAIGANCQIWVEDAHWDTFVTQNEVDSILANLEEYTSPTSIDPSKGIYEIDTEYFGEPPNVDGDGLVDFLVLDIQDGWDGEGGFVAGFFFTGDQSGYNNRDILYLDSNPGIYNEDNETHNIQPVMSTTAHELQHLIHYNYDPGEEDWLNEAMSQLAGTLCGYGLDSPERYLSNTNLSLTGWAENNDPEVLDHYSKVNLWAEYILEQYGLEFITALTRHSLNGTSSVNTVLSNLGLSETFNSTYTDWILCNFINDTDVNTKWGYTHQDALGLRALAENVTSYPFNASGLVEQHGALYYKYFEGDTLSITFNSSSAFAKVIKYGNNETLVENLANGSQYIDTQFNDSIQQEIVVVGSYTTSSFSIQSDASSEYYIVELSHDDGTPDIFDTQSNASLLGTGPGSAGVGWAVKFNVSEQGDNALLGMKINTRIGTGNGDVLIHVWELSGNSPDNDLVTPVQTQLVDGWNDIDLKQLFGEEISISGDFFVGFTHADENSTVYIYMDNSVPQNYTWLIRPNGQHDQLQDLNPDYNNFNMMIRAIVKIKGEAPPEPNLNKYKLKQNYPNPFNPSTKIEYELKEAGNVNLAIYNLLGQKIRTLLHNEYTTILINLEEWDGTDDNGNIVPAGIYFYRIKCDEYTQTKKMIFLR